MVGVTLQKAVLLGVERVKRVFSMRREIHYLILGLMESRVESGRVMREAGRAGKSSMSSSPEFGPTNMAADRH